MTKHSDSEVRLKAPPISLALRLRTYAYTSPRTFPCRYGNATSLPFPSFIAFPASSTAPDFFTSLGDNLAPRKRIGVGAGKESFFSCTIHTIYNPAYGRPKEWPNRPKKKSPSSIFPARQRRLRPRKKRERKRGKIPPGKQQSSSGTWETNLPGEYYGVVQEPVFLPEKEK